MSGTDFAPFMEEVARALCGEPNKRLSGKAELRFGKNGSLSVDLEAGTWFDHEAKEGGGVLDLISRKAGTNANGGAVEWLRERGFPIEEEGPPADDPRFSEHRRPKVVATYDYQDEAGELVYQVVRMEPKTFRQRRRPRPGDDPEKIRNGWVWSVKGVRLVPFRLPELVETLAEERLVFIVEGEKDVLNLAEIGVPATCNPMGAGKWPAHFAEFFAGAHVVILPDNDEAGRNHRDLIGASLSGVARTVRVLDLPGLPDKGDVSDWLAAGGTADSLYELVEQRATPWLAEGSPLHFEAVWFADAETAMSEPEWLIDDLLTRGDRSLIYGESQSGKSFLATHFAMAVARGEPVFGRKVLKPGGVIYVAAEGKKGFKWRLKAYRQYFELAERSDLPFILLPVAVDMFAEEGDYPHLLSDVAIIRQILRARGFSLDLIVFDTHHAVSPGANENASEDVSRMMKHYDRVSEAGGGAHVMIVHHKNAGGEKPRGHTGLYAGVDNAIEVSADEFGTRTARIAKLKDGEDGGKITFRLESVEIGERADGKKITSCVVAPSDQEARHKGGPRLTPQERIALDALREAVLRYGEPAPAMLDLPYGVTVVRADPWKREFMARAFNEEPDPATFRQAVKRVGDGLMAKRVIGRNQPYIWIAREPSA